MLRKYLPYMIYRRLFGDRRKFGLIPDFQDEDWIAFHNPLNNMDIYETTQKQGIGNKICNVGYIVLSRVDFFEKTVLEIGPGIIRHLSHMKNKPESYVICDVNTEFLNRTSKQLLDSGINCKQVRLNQENFESLPFPDETFDIIISFNSLEHLYPLKDYFRELRRLLKRKGLIVGSIPCEGGLAWGAGRLLTTRRYVKRKYGIDYDKIICWKHPNFADFIIKQLDAYFERQYLRLHPFDVLPLDFNLVASFVFKKP